MLVLAAQDGDAEAFSELFRRHYPTVRRVCARKLRDLREADEIAQAAFVRAYEHLDSCDGDRRFGAWVQVIANNLCIDHWRAVHRTTPTHEPIGEDAVMEGHGPEESLLNAEQAKMIQLALASLPDRQRDVVVARDVDGRRPPEIAAALGLSLGAVDSLLLRARRRLAASVQSMSAESGTASVVTTAAITAAGGVVANLQPLVRAASAVSDAFGVASHHVASAAGMVPGAPSIISQAGPMAVAGLLSFTPFAGAVPHGQRADLAPLVAPIAADFPTDVSTPQVVPPSQTAVTKAASNTAAVVEPLGETSTAPKQGPTPRLVPASPASGVASEVAETVLGVPGPVQPAIGAPSVR